MKTLLPLLAILTTLVVPALAQDKAEPGPRGGRLLALDGQKAEFLIQPDRNVSIAFYDDSLAPVAPAGQVVTATAEAPGGKETIEFETDGDTLVSTKPLPEGGDYRIVVQIRPTQDSKPKNFRITYNMNTCAECGLPEYACTCNH